MSDPLHTTRITDHPSYQDYGGTSSVTTSVTWGLKYPTIYVGRKPLRVYIDATRNELRNNGGQGVWVEARGTLISRAILVALRVVQENSSEPLPFPLVMTPIIRAMRMEGNDGKERDVPSISILLHQAQRVNFPTIPITPNAPVDWPIFTPQPIFSGTPMLSPITVNGDSSGN